MQQLLTPTVTLSVLCERLNPDTHGPTERSGGGINKRPTAGIQTWTY